jgi:hypothetical protein
LPAKWPYTVAIAATLLLSLQALALPFLTHHVAHTAELMLYVTPTHLGCTSSTQESEEHRMHLCEDETATFANISLRDGMYAVQLTYRGAMYNTRHTLDEAFTIVGPYHYTYKNKRRRPREDNPDQTIEEFMAVMLS